MRIIQELLWCILAPIIWVFFIIALFIGGIPLMALFIVGMILQFLYELIIQLPQRK